VVIMAEETCWQLQNKTLYIEGSVQLPLKLNIFSDIFNIIIILFIIFECVFGDAFGPIYLLFWFRLKFILKLFQ
jgi:hypothetical protein